MKSIENFEKVAKASVDNNLMRYSVKGKFKMKMLLSLCKLVSNQLQTTFSRLVSAIWRLVIKSAPTEL
jgi:hypothetical protein